jgi:hypothetical protein
MRKLRRAIGVHAGLEHGGLVAVVGHMQLTRDQHHALRGAVPVAGDGEAGGYLEKDICIFLGRVTVQHRDLAALGDEVRARAPLELRIVRGKGQRRFRDGFCSLNR